MSIRPLETPSEFSLSYDALGRVVLKRPGQDDTVDVRLRRSFPWTDPTRYVSVRSSEGKEILLIDDLAVLDTERKAFVDRELARVSFVPRIKSIISINTKFGLQMWHVQTDRGPIEFRVQEREDVRWLHDGRFRVKDADGNVYELAKLEDLDAASQKHLELLI